MFINRGFISCKKKSVGLKLNHDANKTITAASLKKS